jgi:transposase InsO family protein
MSVRRLIVEVDVEGLNVREFCGLHGVSTWFFYDLRRRWRRDGAVALEPRSRVPKRVWNKTSVDVEDLVVAARKHRKDLGLDYGPQDVAADLADVATPAPSAATVYRILRARGFIIPEPRKTPKHAYRRFNAERANESWQLDDTGWTLADGTEVKILNIIDDHSRLLVASVAMPACTGTAALSVVADAAGVLGWPQRFQSDNASTFRHVLADALRPLGVAAVHSRPHHPQTNGKIERFHQSEQKWLQAQDPAATLAELQWLLDVFRHYYNHHRPHRGIGRRTPAEVWSTAPKAGPADRPLQPPSTIHHTQVTNGTLTAYPYTISLGVTHNTHQALTIITGLACHVFINGHLIRQLTLNPTRRVQTQPPPPRPPPPTTRTQNPPPRWGRPPPPGG